MKDWFSFFTFFFWYQYVLVPIFGTICFVFGAVILFVVSGGRWKVTGWPKYSDKQDFLEPWKIKLNNRTFWSADAAMTVGFGVLIAGALLVLTIFVFK